MTKLYMTKISSHVPTIDKFTYLIQLSFFRTNFGKLHFFVYYYHLKFGNKLK